MNRLLISGAAVAAVLTLAACGGTSGNNSDGATGSGTGETTVSAERIGGAGRVLVDSAGQALYFNDQENGGKVLCTRACTSFWPR